MVNSFLKEVTVVARSAPPDDFWRFPAIGHCFWRIFTVGRYQQSGALMVQVGVVLDPYAGHPYLLPTITATAHVMYRKDVRPSNTSSALTESFRVSARLPKMISGRLQPPTK